MRFIGGVATGIAVAVAALVGLAAWEKWYYSPRGARR